MTEHDTTPAPAPKVETKVKAAVAWSYLAALAGLAVVNGVTDTTLITDLPDTIELFVAPLVPAAAAGLAGFIAKHSRRPDLPASRR